MIAARLVAPLFAGHAGLILFSTVALVTFLAGPPPAWLAQEPNATAYRMGWTYSGPTYVVLGAAAALAHLAARVGWGRAAATFALTSLVALGSELLGTSTGFPFGPYSYTSLLGLRVLGKVPFPIPVSWAYMIYASLAIVARVLAPGDGWRTRVRWALLGGAVLTAWDVAMDPAMSFVTKHWVWHVDGAFYGMPWVNWAGWYATGVVVSLVMLALIPPSRLAPRVAPSRFPLALYAANGVMPIAMCFRSGLWWAATGGLIAMAIPLAAALRARARRSERGLALAGAAGD
ncbi:MAG TPA: carotenoid biosynthesis protein [Gemmatimonadaceae bacterium]|nr:carotenoid biosynthesis protein [Gemmatimonadaceae bacterium]